MKIGKFYITYKLDNTDLTPDQVEEFAAEVCEEVQRHHITKQERFELVKVENLDE